MQTIRIVQISLSFHRASAVFVSAILERFGYAVLVLEASHEEAFQMLANGDADMLVSAWLPGSHQKYLDGSESEVIKLGMIYEPYCIWAIPDYAPKAIQAVSDLKRAIAGRMERIIFTINPGAGISRFSREVMEQYNLKNEQYELRNSSEKKFLNHVEKGLLAKKLFVIPFWHPQALHDQYLFRELAEPLNLLRSKDEATLLIRKDLYNEIPEQLITALNNIYLGNAKVSALDNLLYRQFRSINDALEIIKTY